MKTEKKVVDKVSVVMMICGILGMLVGILCAVFGALGVKKMVAAEVDFPTMGENETDANAQYSVLTGEALAEGETANAPIYCIQTPNGLDGGRPQAGLDEAGVIFEAIAEAGITRFAAIYQKPEAGVIGPIRSLRTYYLEWDTPFDCTIVHAGGSGDALMALANGGYKELDEDYDYMYRGTYVGRGWNNLFTTGELLAKATAGETSNAKGFVRMSPEESLKARIDSGAVSKLVITEPAEGDTSEVAAEVPEVKINFGGASEYDVNYNYDVETNTYVRSYGSGDEGSVYQCGPENGGYGNPEEICSLVRMTPSVVVAMVVEESRAADNYHEDIEAIGMGTAYIFQNGTVIEGTWSKGSAADQIKFFDAQGNEAKLAVGQTIVEAVPGYGGVEY